MTLAQRLRQLLSSIAAAATIFTAAPAAQAALNYSDGDLFLSFRATGGQGATTDYIVNIGPASQFIGTSGSVSVALGNIVGVGSVLDDLVSIYGADWRTRTDFLWSISGVQKAAGNGFAKNTMFASNKEPVAGTQSTPWTSPSAFGAGTPALKMQTMGTPGYSAGTTSVSPGQTESTNSTKALSQNTAAANSYASYMPGGTNTTGSSAFGYFNSALGIENNFDGGTASSVLDLYKLEPASGSLPGVLLGAFRLSDSAVLTFNTDITAFQGPAQVNLSSATYSVGENGGMLAVTITRSGTLTSAFSVNLSTTDGTALAGTDFTGQTGVPVAFAANDVSKVVNIPITDVAGYQGDRAFSVSIALGSGNAQLGAVISSEVTIVENDPQPSTLTLSAATYTIAEDGAPLTVTIHRAGSTVAAGTVYFSTSDDTALAGTDFVGQTNVPVTFAIGDTSKTVDIAITDRVNFQGARSFGIALSAPDNGGTLGTPATATVSITETDPAPVVSLEFGTYSVSEAVGTGKITINVLRTVDTASAVAVTFNASGGTAAKGSDYTFAAPVTVSFAAGDTSKAVDIAILNAPSYQGSRTFNATLSSPTNGATLGTAASAIVTITDDDAAPGGAVAGTYSGLVRPTGTASHNTSGFITLKITPTNTFTGKVLIGGATLPISGSFGANGIAKFNPSLGTSTALTIKGKVPVQLGNLALTIFADSILGTLKTPGTVATVAADHAAFDGKTPASTVNALFLANKGKYNCLLPSKNQTVLTHAQFPQGDGIGILSVSKNGNVTFKGNLADGSAFSASATLAKGYTLPIYASLYAKKGSLSGLATLSLADIVNASANSDLSATDLLWLAPAAAVPAKAKYYPAGWPTGVKVDLFGANYRAPQKGDATSVFPGLGADNLLTGNATVQFADGKLAAPINKAVNITTKNKVTNAPATDKTFKLTLTASTGALKGNLTDDSGKKPAFKGIVYQKGTIKGGFGYFLSTVPKGGPSGESGGVTVLAK